jgi:starch-binding outer membrane protein, SusD/RagB family
MKKVRNTKLFVIILLVQVIGSPSCKKFVEVENPKTLIIDKSVFTNDASANSAILGIYSKMMESNTFASVYTTLYSSLSSDELVNYSNNPAFGEFYSNAVTPLNNNLKNFWGDAYSYIFAANSIFEGASSSIHLSEGVKQQLIGEARFIRAFCYFNLSMFFGDVPLITTTDYRINAISDRTPLSKIYKQIIEDLQEAKGLLKEDYSFSNGERVRPNKWTATALLSRMYLFIGEWANAETQATFIINNNPQYSLVKNLNEVFLKNSSEAIWQLVPVRPNVNTNEGEIFVLTAAPGGSFGVAVSKYMLNAFDSGDVRKNTWIGSISLNNQTYYYPNKYKVKLSSTISEYYMVFRLSEQYLIRAESRAQQNNISGAVSDLNIIRERAKLPNFNTNDKTALLNAILHERQVELFTEWGLRWFDLKRTNTSNTILGPIKSPNWQSTDVLYPIPQSEINNNANLIQNSGY